LLVQLSMSAQLTGWPALDVPPPNVTEYTALVNMSKVANAPVKSMADITGNICLSFDDGHKVGVHTWSHSYLTSQSIEQVIAELQWTATIIKNVTGITPLYMRPPFSDYDDRIRNICTQLWFKVVIWDKDTNDWLSADDKTFQMTWVEGNFTQWVGENRTTGHISLEHDLYYQTAAQ
ncbi:18105_t:CDS:2, partial [Racocetra persica]